MIKNTHQYLPKISSTSDKLGEHAYYTDAVRNVLSHVLPSACSKEEMERYLKELLPVVVWNVPKKPPFNISFFLLCEFRANAYRFFYDMISRWLIPGKTMNVPLQFALDFSFPDLGKQLYIGGEVVLTVSSEAELAELNKNLPSIDSEIRLGVQSYYHANRILEIKGYTADEKTAMIQENIASLVKHRPQDFDYDVFQEMQHFLVLCKEEFKAARPFKHMSRIICVHYLFRKALRLSYESFPDRRYVSVKLIRAKLYTSKSEKWVLGIAIGMSFLKESECFEERHILKGVSMLLPNVKGVKGSFFRNTGRTDPTCTYYLEVEKKEGAPFSLEEFRRLKEELPDALGRSVERRENPVFMPQNEEEVMRNIVRLSKEIELIRDIPQVMISYRSQTEKELEFLILLVRVVKDNPTSFQTFFDATPTFLTFIPGRVKTIGNIQRKKEYKKEANIFTLKIKKGRYLRHDHSVDLYKARQELAAELQLVIGEFRDFNGGMLSKEKEVFQALSSQLPSLGRKNSHLLETFFHTLSPPAMRSVLPASYLKKLFTLLLEGGQEGPSSDEGVLFRLGEGEALFIALIGKEDGFRGVVERAIAGLLLPSCQLATTFIQVKRHPCLGVLYRPTSKNDAQVLRLAIEDAITSYEQRRRVELSV